MKQALIAIFSLASLCGSAQGAWPKAKGEGFFKLSETIIVSESFYTPEGTIRDIKTAGVYISSFYGEYGLTNNLTAVAYVPFFFRNTINAQEFTLSPNMEEADEANSFGDVNLGLQYGILKKGPFVLSTSLVFGIPSGQTNGGNSQLLQSGDGEFNQILRVHAGYSFYPKPFYAAGYLGINNRTNGFSDEFRAGLEAGTSINSWFLALKMDWVESLQNGNAEASQTGIFSNNTEYISFGPEVAYNFKGGLGISGSVLGAFKGQNILASPSISLGVFYDLRRK